MPHAKLCEGNIGIILLVIMIKKRNIQGARVQWTESSSHAEVSLERVYGTG